MEKINQVFSELSTPQVIAITMHQKPDPDAMGSALALCLYLKKCGHTATVISPTNWADFLKWMPGADEVIDYEAKKSAAEAILSSVQWLFCLDFNHFSRTRNMETILANLPCKKVLIDHHREPQTESFNYGISDISKSSTAEMIYDFIINSGAYKINPEKIESAIEKISLIDHPYFVGAIPDAVYTDIAVLVVECSDTNHKNRLLGNFEASK